MGGPWRFKYVATVMEDTRRYLERKYEELSLISRCLRHADPLRPKSVDSLIAEKFRLAAQLKSQHTLKAWQNTETRWCTTALRSGPFAFDYRYQRADLAVSGPSPYPGLNSIPGAEMY